MCQSKMSRIRRRRGEADGRRGGSRSSLGHPMFTTVTAIVLLLLVSKTHCCRGDAILATSAGVPSPLLRNHYQHQSSSRQDEELGRSSSKTIKMKEGIAAAMISSSSDTEAIHPVGGGEEAFIDDGYFQPWRYNPFTLNVTGPDASYPRIKDALPDQSLTSQVRRKLAGGTTYSNSPTCGVYPNTDPCCIRCLSLSKCSVLNHKYIEDKYTPGYDALAGSCNALEYQASRLDVFGIGKTFRDNDLCRQLVYDYTCLWWGGASGQYDNRCGSCCSGLDLGLPLRPCRSFCDKIANICANNIDYQELCNSIPCPPSDTTCDLGPAYTSDTAGLEPCYISTYATYYSPAAPSLQPTHWLLGTFTLIVGGLMLIAGQ